MAILNIDRGWHCSVRPPEHIHLGMQSHEIHDADNPLYFIFAIGSYETSSPHGKDTGFHDHFRYFEQGFYFSRELRVYCFLTDIWVLIVQCFFLLAICHTDR